MNDAFYTVDIHAHLLPGLDDGPAKMDDALRMCELYVAQGVGAVVATPHMGDSRYDVSPSRVRAALESLRGECTRQGLGLTLLAGADVRLGPDTLGRLDAGDVLTLADRGEHLLLEMPGGALPPLNGFLAELERRGLTAVISHPERHPEFALGESAESQELLHAAAPDDGRFGLGIGECRFQPETDISFHSHRKEDQKDDPRRLATRRALGFVQRLWGDGQGDGRLPRPARVRGGSHAGQPRRTGSELKIRRSAEGGSLRGSEQGAGLQNGVPKSPGSQRNPDPLGPKEIPQLHGLSPWSRVGYTRTVDSTRPIRRRGIPEPGRECPRGVAPPRSRSPRRP